MNIVMLCPQCKDREGFQPVGKPVGQAMDFEVHASCECGYQCKISVSAETITGHRLQVVKD